MGSDGGGGVGEVAGAGAANRGEAQFPGAGQGHAHHPVFEGEGGHVHPIVLDVELLEAQAASQTVGAQQRSEASADINRLTLDGQEIAITPDRSGAGLDGGAADAGANGVVVVNDFKRTKANVFTDVTSFGRIGMATFFAAQASEGLRCQGCGHTDAAVDRNRSSDKRSS